MRFVLIILGVLCALAWLGAASPVPEAENIAAEDPIADFSDALRFKRAPIGEFRKVLAKLEELRLKDSKKKG